MLKTRDISGEVERIVEKYGQGFDVIYFDGKADGIAEDKADGAFDGKVEVAINLLKNGMDEEFTSINTGLSIDQIREIKRKL